MVFVEIKTLGARSSMYSRIWCRGESYIWATSREALKSSASKLTYFSYGNFTRTYNNVMTIARILQARNDTDLGVCNRPWQMFALGKADRSLFVTNNRCIPDKSTMDWCAVVFCACEIIQSSVVSYVVIVVHKFGFIVDANETPVSRRPCVTETHVFDRLYMFSSRPSSRVLQDSIHVEQVSCILLRQRLHVWLW